MPVFSVFITNAGITENKLIRADTASAIRLAFRPMIEISRVSADEMVNMQAAGYKLEVIPTVGGISNADPAGQKSAETLVTKSETVAGANGNPDFGDVANNNPGAINTNISTEKPDADLLINGNAVEASGMVIGKNAEALTPDADADTHQSANSALAS